MALAMHAIKKMKISWGILTETKLIEDTYTKNSNGYTIIATESQDCHKGGVALFYVNDSKLFTIEGVKSFGMNVIRATLISGKKRWTIIGCYIPPSEKDNVTLDNIQKALQHDNNDEIILMGDLNVNIYKMDKAKDRHKQTVALLSSLCLTDLQKHYRVKNNERWT